MLHLDTDVKNYDHPHMQDSQAAPYGEGGGPTRAEYVELYAVPLILPHLPDSVHSILYHITSFALSP